MIMRLGPRQPDLDAWSMVLRGDPRPMLDREAWRDIVKRDPCSYCGGPADSIDHVHPKSVGGSNEPSNLVSACRKCNTLKGSAPVLWFILLRGGVGEIPGRDPQALAWRLANAPEAQWPEPQPGTLTAALGMLARWQDPRLRS